MYREALEAYGEEWVERHLVLIPTEQAESDE